MSYLRVNSQDFLGAAQQWRCAWTVTAGDFRHGSAGQRRAIGVDLAEPTAGLGLARTLRMTGLAWYERKE
jgi:hypothetical protein